MGSFYAAALAVVEDYEGAILFVQEGKEHIHGKWDLPGGGWEDGESITECVKREVLEETGYEIELTGLLGILKEENQRDGTETITLVFKSKALERKFDGPKDGEEIIDTGFFRPGEIDESQFRMENRKAILERHLEGEEYPLEILWNNLNFLSLE